MNSKTLWMFRITLFILIQIGTVNFYYEDYQAGSLCVGIAILMYARIENNYKILNHEL
jgi:hypothetical protein